MQSELEAEDIDQLAVVAMAGVAAEAMQFEEVMGQTADLMDLQRLLNRSSVKLSNMQQQDATRWAGMHTPSLLPASFRPPLPLLASYNLSFMSPKIRQGHVHERK
jgi:uncharacterized protein YlxP (DUF503 family)